MLGILWLVGAALRSFQLLCEVVNTHTWSSHTSCVSSCCVRVRLALTQEDQTCKNGDSSTTAHTSIVRRNVRADVGTTVCMHHRLWFFHVCGLPAARDDMSTSGCKGRPCRAEHKQLFSRFVLQISIVLPVALVMPPRGCDGMPSSELGARRGSPLPHFFVGAPRCALCIERPPGA